MFLTLPVFRGIIRYVIRSHAILHEIISFPLWTVPYRSFARRTCAKAPLPTNGAYRRASFCCPRSNFNWQPDSYCCSAWSDKTKNIHWDRYIKYRYVYITITITDLTWKCSLMLTDTHASRCPYCETLPGMSMGKCSKFKSSECHKSRD